MACPSQAENRKGAGCIAVADSALLLSAERIMNGQEPTQERPLAFQVPEIGTVKLWRYGEDSSSIRINARLPETPGAEQFILLRSSGVWSWDNSIGAFCNYHPDWAAAVGDIMRKIEQGA